MFEEYFIFSLHLPLYHGLAIYTGVTFVNVHHTRMFTLVNKVCLWYFGFVLVFILSFHYEKLKNILAVV